MLLTIDAIGSDGTLLKLAVSQAQARGVNISLDRVILSASHSHSGPGALTPSFLWAIVCPNTPTMLAHHRALD